MLKNNNSFSFGIWHFLVFLQEALAALSKGGLNLG